MNWKLIGLWTVLTPFSALSAYAVWQYGYAGLFDAVFTNLGTASVFADLVIALSLVMLWMIGDARQRGTAPLPYVVATLLLGSIGPLLYLIRRERNAGVPATAVPAGGRRVPA